MRKMKWESPVLLSIRAEEAFGHCRSGSTAQTGNTCGNGQNTAAQGHYCSNGGIASANKGCTAGTSPGVV